MEPLRIACGMANCYLLKGAQGCILVDAGAPGSLPTIEKAMARLGISPRDMSLVLLTHGHTDHTGTADALRSKYGVPVAMHPADEGRARAEAMTGDGVFGKLLLFVSRMEKYVPPPRPDILLQDGMSLLPYGVAGCVVALPGHTPGSVGVLLQDRHLVAGDMFMNFVGPHAAHMAEDFAAMRRSAGTLQTKQVKVVWPGHGAAFAYTRLAGRL